MRGEFLWRDGRTLRVVAEVETVASTVARGEWRGVEGEGRGEARGRRWRWLVRWCLVEPSTTSDRAVHATGIGRPVGEEQEGEEQEGEE